LYFVITLASSISEAAPVPQGYVGIQLQVIRQPKPKVKSKHIKAPVHKRGQDYAELYLMPTEFPEDEFGPAQPTILKQFQPGEAFDLPSYQTVSETTSVYACLVPTEKYTTTESASAGTDSNDRQVASVTADMSIVLDPEMLYDLFTRKANEWQPTPGPCKIKFSSAYTYANAELVFMSAISGYLKDFACQEQFEAACEPLLTRKMLEKPPIIAQLKIHAIRCDYFMRLPKDKDEWKFRKTDAPQPEYYSQSMHSDPGDELFPCQPCPAECEKAAQSHFDDGDADRIFMTALKLFIGMFIGWLVTMFVFYPRPKG